MIKQLSKHVLMATTATTLALGASSAFAQQFPDIKADMKGVIPYVIDSRGVVARNSTGLCWRTGYWTPQLAAQFPEMGCKCDKDLLPKEVCEPPAPPPAAPAPEAAPKPAAEKVTLAADALFDFDKAVLRPEGRAKLDDVVGKLPSIKLEVIIAVGHTDRLGSDKYNQKLSERRAEAVKAYLVSKGVEPNRVYTEGKGEKQPVTGDKCKGNRPTKGLIQCLQPDRRVEIEIIGTKEAAK